MRKIIHVDMDAFYAAIEQRDDPSLRGRPVAVGGSSGRGVVATASYEARRFGVGSAMPSIRAMRLCPDLVFVKPRFDVYKATSRQVRAILERYTPLIEPLSLDEAYLDVTGAAEGTTAVAIARSIKEAIQADTGLTASAGVSFNKFLAKTASGLVKPDGLTVIRPDQAERFLADLPIERFHGVGPATAKRLREHGIAHGRDLQCRSEAEVAAVFGRIGQHFWRIAKAQDERTVEPHRVRKSLSVETTFFEDLRSPSEIQAQLAEIADELALRLTRAGFRGRTLTLKIRYADFDLATRRSTAKAPMLDAADIQAEARRLMGLEPRPSTPIRLLGLGVSADHAEHDSRQMELPLSDASSLEP
ncbi:MAG: DNA polymerase IV [Geminicoccaceae bacterium]